MMQGFSDIVGSKSIIKSMAAAIARGHIGHAYIIEGPAGSGKSLMAATFAATILCENSTASGPCLSCISCITLQSGNNPDVVFVRAQKRALGIDDVREQIIENLSILPYAAEKRIYILESAHTLTIPAQNALLKTLEDAPKYAVFLLLAENSRAFLPTILSRCVLYKIAPLADASIMAHLNAQGIDAARAAAAVPYAAGAIGRAAALALDDDFMAFRDEILKVAHSIEQNSITEIFAAAKRLEAQKDRIGQALDILTMHYRGVMLGAGSPAAAITKIRIIDDIRQKLNQNCNFLLTMEVMLLKLSQKENP